MSSFNDIWNVIGPQQNRTKCPPCRAINSYKAFKAIEEKGLEGDCVELGVWKGGISALFGKLCEEENKNRKVWSFDSFQGMSECGEHDMVEGENKVHLAKLPPVQLRNFNFTDFNKTCYEMMGLREETMNAVPGWVNDTLPVYSEKIDKISILRVDLDWYEPTKEAFEHLYAKVVKGGYIICDDFGYWKGARKAILDFRKLNNITDPIIQTPKMNGGPQPNLKTGTEHYWIKSV